MPHAKVEVGFMKIERLILFFPAVLVVGYSLVLMGHGAKAAAPLQAKAAATAPAKAGAAAGAMAKSASVASGTGAVSIPDTTIAVNSDKPMSERVVHYEIDAKYDAAKHTVDATEVLTYHNLTGQALDHFPFHLYQNAFQQKATFVREAKLVGSRDTAYAKWEEKDYGSEDIKSIEVVGQGDLTAQLQYQQPDDGNKDDKTVVDLHVPQAIAPGAYVQFKIAFQTKFPETQARSGWKRDFVLGGQWFPKVGVFWHGAWNCHQYHNTTEFFADFGVYDVKLTAPNYEVVGASGVLVSDAANSDGTKTYVYHGDDIHDFAWTASPRYKVKDDGVFQGQMGPVKLRIMMQPAHWSQAERHEKILMQTLERFEKWYGPYPYKTLTLVDPEPDSAAGGMEYPTFITGDSSWFMPKGVLLPEVVVEHEFGHQYWYGMVATNEFEDAWMDEGINSYTEVKVLDSIFGQDRSMLQQAGVTLSEREEQRLSYIGVADLDAMAQKAYEYYGSNSYGGITYGKTASVLLTLEGIVGEDTMAKAMHTYFMKYRFTHPVKEDFLKTIEEVSGKDLRWYFNQAVYGTQVLDYEVRKVDSFPTNWYEDEKKGAGKKKDDDKDTVYLSTVWLHRKGDFVMPVELEVKFTKGEKVREHWDGQSRWVKFQYEKKAKIESAEIDPDHKILIDRDNFNNSRTAEPDPKPRRKLSNYWLFVTQWLGQAAAWWAV
ncbi:MAG TPA: M1 family metallopeptidase [Candidatus Sulfotelmatobacter sp.]|nr:M1 family metallopeptidase [Candidatus Sulfotelmatobacter sp.]